MNESTDGTWDVPGVTHWDGCGDVGTPEHAGCKKRSELPETFPPGDYAAGFGDGYGRAMTDAARHALRHEHDPTKCADDMRDAYDDGVQDSMLRATQYERVLTDLIAELRKRHRQVACPCDSNCGFAFDTCECGDEWPCEETYDFDRAEARLREVFDSNVYGSVAMGEVYGDE